MADRFTSLMTEIRQCRLCESALTHEPRPVLAAHPEASLIIIGQAPGKKVHESGIAWDDASGKALRKWLGMDEAIFYDKRRVAIIPMGFCYPGKGKSGDLPPRPECAPQWHPPLLEGLRRTRLTLLIGQYAQARYLGNKRGKNLTDTVKRWREYLPSQLPLPHPSPRNRFWMAKNPWFSEEVLPELKRRVAELFG